jgi:ribokinase
MNPPSVVVVGGSNTDLVVQSPRFPKPGESVIGGLFAKFQGGKGANQAVAAARSGAHSTFIGSVGVDSFGQEALAMLGSEGIDIRYILQDEKQPTGIALIIVDAAGENEIVVALGANLALTSAQIDQALEVISTADAVLCQLEIPIDTVTHLAAVTEGTGRRLVLNPAPATPLPDSIYPCIDVITPNLGELGAITGFPVDTLDHVEKAASSLLRKGVGSVVVTQGREGSLTVTPEESWWTEAIQVDARDTVGAGDCFSANLAVALAEGRPLKEAVRFATVAAGISVTRIGAQPSMPYRAEIDTLLAGFGS